MTACGKRQRSWDFRRGEISQRRIWRVHWPIYLRMCSSLRIRRESGSILLQPRNRLRSSSSRRGLLRAELGPAAGGARESSWARGNERAGPFRKPAPVVTPPLDGAVQTSPAGSPRIITGAREARTWKDAAFTALSSRSNGGGPPGPSPDPARSHPEPMRSPMRGHIQRIRARPAGRAPCAGA